MKNGSDGNSVGQPNGHNSKSQQIRSVNCPLSPINFSESLCKFSSYMQKLSRRPELMKTYQRLNTDRISELPEELIIHIISLLELKEAIKTGILSKRWKNLWNKIYNIVLGSNFPRNLLSIDHSLFQCISPTIKKFTLHLWSHRFSGKKIEFVNNWLKHALNKDVEFLSLKCMGMSMNIHSTPNCLYQSSSLITLEICGLNIDNLFLITLPSLKSLSLERVYVKDESIEKIILGCPVLETLSFNEVDGIDHLNIMSPSVKKFILQSMGEEVNNTSDWMLKVRAPWLEELVIMDGFLVPQFQLLDISSLNSASLLFTTHSTSPFDEDWIFENEEYCEGFATFNLKWIAMVTGLLNSLQNVTELLIGSQLIQVCSLLKLSDVSPMSFTCKRVKVKTPIWKYDLPGIAWLLQSTPNVEALTIEVSKINAFETPLEHIVKYFVNNDPHLSMPDGELKNLKNFKIDYVRNSCKTRYECDPSLFFDLELVGYILRSAVALENLVVCSTVPHCDECKMECKFQHVTVLSSKLFTTFLSLNEGAKWEIKKKKFAFEFIKIEASG